MNAFDYGFSKFAVALFWIVDGREDWSFKWAVDDGSDARNRATHEIIHGVVNWRLSCLLLLLARTMNVDVDRGYH